MEWFRGGGLVAKILACFCYVCAWDGEGAWQKEYN